MSNTYATKTSLSDYATVTAMNSAITQSASSILTTVSSNYATKASLEVKIDKDKLISEINASADVITLKSNRFILDSTNAKISADGTVNFIGGTIGGWNISSTKLSGSAGFYGIAINKPATTATKVININHIDTTAAATYVDCELSVYGTQRLKYELYVEGNIHGNVISASDKNVKKDIQALNIEDLMNGWRQ